MEKPRRSFQPKDFQLYDGSGINTNEDDYGTGDYLNFVSNGSTNNEKIDSTDYYDLFLNKSRKHDDHNQAF